MQYPHVITLLVPLLALAASAQVVRDGSMGAAPAGAVGSGLDPTGDLADYLITEDLGERSGSSLYHSFDTFEINPGELATFTGDSGIDLVISRVTGGDVLRVNGTLRSTIDGAEHFFLSAGGVAVGAGAQLDIPGSVHFSTASTLRFEDPAFDLPIDSVVRPALLSALPPSAYGFGALPAGITVGAVDANDFSRTLSVPEGETLSFVGGDIVMLGVPAPFTGDVIRAPGATVELASTASAADIPIAQVDGRSRLDTDLLPADALDGDVFLGSNARIEVGAGTGTDGAAGSVVVRAGSFRISDGRIEANRHRSDVTDAGTLDIGTRDRIDLRGGQILSWAASDRPGADVLLTSREVSIAGDSLLRVLGTGAGPSGDLVIDAETVSISEGSLLITQNSGTSEGGDLRIRARAPDGLGRIDIIGDGTSTGLQSRPVGSRSGGAIRLETDTLALRNVAEVSSLSQGDASGGAIDVFASDLLVLEGSILFTSTMGTGGGGGLHVEGLDGARADRILIRNAGGEVEPARITTNTLGGATGDGGDLTLRTERLDLIAGGQVFARTQSAGDAGTLDIEADWIHISGVLDNPSSPSDPFRSGITSRVGDGGATGNGTLLSIDTRILEVFDGGQISTATFGVGDAGELRIVATDRMSVIGGANGASLVSAQAVAGPTSPGGGNGGLLSIDTAFLELRDAGQISAATVGLGDPGDVGDAGDVTIRAGRVEITGDPSTQASGVFSVSDSQAVQGVGNGGNVLLEVDGDLVLTGAARIEVSASGEGDAGNVDLDVGGSLRMDDGASILSSSGDTSRGLAGSVEVTTDQNIVLSRGSLISASTGADSTGSGGSVSLTAGGNIALGTGSEVRSSSGGIGDAGDIQMTAGIVSASGGSAISTQADEASGGSITVNARELFEVVDSSATTSVRGRVGSDAGSIEVHTPGSLLVNHGALVAQAVEGAGGRIEVEAGNSFVSGDSLISASSEQGPQGELDLTPPEDALISELASLPAALVDPSQLLANACDLRTEREGSFQVAAGSEPAAQPPPGASLPAALAVPAGAACAE